MNPLSPRPAGLTLTALHAALLATATAGTALAGAAGVEALEAPGPTRAIASTAPAELPGYDRLAVEAEHRDRPLGGSLWYPAVQDGYRSAVGADAAFVGEPVLQGPIPAETPPGGRPLVLISHGSGGNADNLGWLSAALVAHGALVAGIDHPGSTSGDSSPRRAIRLHERTADIAALLDALLADATFGPLIDPDDITVLGFSLGGTAALQSVGARLDHAAYARYCAAPDDGAVDCRYFERGGVDIATLDRDAFEASARDPRVSRAVAVDPGFGHAMSEEALATIEVPVQLINLGTRAERWTAVDVSPEGNDLAARLPDARYEEVEEANHFTFLGVCTDAAPTLLAREGEDPICDDPAGVERAETHERLAALIAAFAVTRER